MTIEIQKLFICKCDECKNRSFYTSKDLRRGITQFLDYPDIKEYFLGAYCLFCGSFQKIE